MRVAGEVWLLLVIVSVLGVLPATTWLHQRIRGGTRARDTKEWSTRRRVKLYLYSATSWGVCIDLADIALSLALCLLIVVEAYSGTLETTWFEFVSGIVLTLTFLFRFYLADNRFEFSVSRVAVVDIVTVIPMLAMPWLGDFDYTIGLRVIRITRALRLSHILLEWRPRQDESSTRLTILMRLLWGLLSGMFALVFFTTSLLYVVEDWAESTQLHTVLYFVMVETLGRPNLQSSVCTVSGLCVLIVLVVASVLTVPPRILQLYQHHQSLRHSSTRLRVRKGYHHVLLCGDLNPSRLEDFLSEFFGYFVGSRSNFILGVVCRADNLARLESVVRNQQYTKNVQLIPTRSVDTDRLRHADLSHVFIFSQPVVEDPMESDMVLAQWLTALKGRCPQAHFYTQVQTPGVRHMVTSLPMYAVGKDAMVSVQEMRCKIMGFDCVCPAFSTLVANLCMSHWGEEEEESGAQWLVEYRQGHTNCIHKCTLHSSMLGKPLNLIALHLLSALGTQLVCIRRQRMAPKPAPSRPTAKPLQRNGRHSRSMFGKIRSEPPQRQPSAPQHETVSEVFICPLGSRVVLEANDVAFVLARGEEGLDRVDKLEWDARWASEMKLSVHAGPDKWRLHKALAVESRSPPRWHPAVLRRLEGEHRPSSPPKAAGRPKRVASDFEGPFVDVKVSNFHDLLRLAALKKVLLVSGPRGLTPRPPEEVRHDPFVGMNAAPQRERGAAQHRQQRSESAALPLLSHQNTLLEREEDTAGEGEQQQQQQQQQGEEEQQLPPQQQGRREGGAGNLGVVDVPVLTLQDASVLSPSSSLLFGPNAPLDTHLKDRSLSGLGVSAGRGARLGDHHKGVLLSPRGAKHPEPPHAQPLHSDASVARADTTRHERLVVLGVPVDTTAFLSVMQHKALASLAFVCPNQAAAEFLRGRWTLQQRPLVAGVRFVVGSSLSLRVLEEAGVGSATCVMVVNPSCSWRGDEDTLHWANGNAQTPGSTSGGGNNNLGDGNRNGNRNHEAVQITLDDTKSVMVVRQVHNLLDRVGHFDCRVVCEVLDPANLPLVVDVLRSGPRSPRPRVASRRGSFASDVARDGARKAFELASGRVRRALLDHCLGLCIHSPAILSVIDSLMCGFVAVPQNGPPGLAMCDLVPVPQHLHGFSYEHLVFHFLLVGDAVPLGLFRFDAAHQDGFVLVNPPAHLTVASRDRAYVLRAGVVLGESP